MTETEFRVRWYNVSNNHPVFMMWRTEESSVTLRIMVDGIQKEVGEIIGSQYPHREFEEHPLFVGYRLINFTLEEIDALMNTLAFLFPVENFI